MPYCSNCGVRLEGEAEYCSACGTPVPRTGKTDGHGVKAPGATMTQNVAAAMAYILGPITGILFLIIEPYRDDRFVRFHAFQSIFYGVVWLVFHAVWRVLTAIMITASFGLMSILLHRVWELISLALTAVWIFLMYKAYNKEKYMLPIIGPLAAQQSG